MRIAVIAGGLTVSVLGAFAVAVADPKGKSETIHGAADEKLEYPGQRNNLTCKDLPSAADLKRLLKEAASGGAA
ncbi:MAG TPA: hypothetical protein VIA18_33150, partial [Polyangia bacterium]|nr:hypothetical protein [Polyangia bacterium]